MKQQIFSAIATSVLLATSAVAIAQQPAATAVSPAVGTSSPAAPAAVAAPVTTVTPPQPGRYIGPSSASVITVKQLLAKGKNEQYARLQGKIVSHDQGENYTFADDSGNMSVEISSKRFPPGQTISADQRVELSGQMDKEWRKTEFEVSEIRLLP